MQLSRISDHELLGRLDRLVRRERKMTHIILCHINEIESRKLYAELGFDSMFKYLTKHCGYGEDSAYRRLQAARLLRKNPDVADKIRDGSLNLTQLTQVQKCLKKERTMDPERAQKVLRAIENKSSFDTKKVLAVEFNLPIESCEIVKPQRDETVRIEFTVTEEQLKILNKAKDLLSHILPEGSLGEVFIHLAERHVQKTLGRNPKEIENLIAAGKDELELGVNRPKKLEPANIKTTATEAPKIEIRSESAEQAVSQATKETTRSFLSKREHIKLTQRRRLLKKSDYSCEFIDPITKSKCQSTYQLQVDHKIPLARGGSSSEENLRILCRTHNLLMAQRWGLSKELSQKLT